MYKNILDIIICPECGEKLNLEIIEEISGEVIKGKLYCCSSHVWEVEDGVINFKSMEQTLANNWSEMYKEVDYDELDRQIREGTPKSQIDAMEAGKNKFVDLIGKRSGKKVLDIATGRGMLMTKLVDTRGSNIELTCVDLSFEVLKHDRIKSMKIDPSARVNYIACDATKLPFVENAFDLSVSFFGIMNMGALAPKGVGEAVRVSREGLINSGFVIKDDNPRIDELNKLLADNGYDFDIRSCTESSFYNMHKSDDVNEVGTISVYEGIAEENKYDIIPVEGQWFACVLFWVKK